MTNRTWMPVMLFMLTLATMLSGCQIVEGIFKAGVWVGVIVVVLIIALVLFLLSKLL